MNMKTQVAKTITIPGGQVVPDYIKNRQGQASGLKADAEDFVVPRVKVLHGTSKEPENFNTAKAGQFWANVLDIDLGPEFKFIPISNRKRVLLMRPIDDKTGEGILARSEDGKTWDRIGKWDVKLKGRRDFVTWEIKDLDVRKSGLLEYGTSDAADGDSNPAATVFHDYLIYLPGHPQLGVVLFSFARTAAKKAKQFNTKIEMRGGPMTTQQYTLKAVKETNGAGQEFWNVDVFADGFPSEADVEKCDKFAERYKNYRGADEEAQAREEAGGAKAPAAKRKGDEEF